MKHKVLSKALFLLYRNFKEILILNKIVARLSIRRGALILMLLCLFVPETVFAELSVTNKWRIEQATHRCKDLNNKLKYQDYWKDAASQDSDAVICMAEQVADLIVSEGEAWLEKKAVELIKECKEETKKDMSKYFLCLQKELKRATNIVSLPCKELGREQLWDTTQCRRLVTFIFMKEFEYILEENKTQIKKVHATIDRIKEVKVARVLFNPLIAIIFFYLLALVFVFFIDRGNWMRVSKWGIATGPFIIASCFLYGGWRFFIAGIAILTLAGCIIWNRRKPIIKVFKKIIKKIGF